MGGEVMTSFAPRRATEACVCTACETRSMALCAALAEDEIGALEAAMTPMSLSPNQLLVLEGDRRARVYSLTSGMLRLSTALPDGRRQIVGFLMPGDYLGLADDETYSSTAEAVGAATLCTFAAADMEALVERFPRLKSRLLDFTRKALRQARENQMVLGRLTPVEKLAGFLLMMASRAAEHGLPTHPVELPMSRTDIADYLGLTIETVSRSFTKLRSRQLISLASAHRVEIVNPRALSQLARLEHP